MNSTGISRLVAPDRCIKVRMVCGHFWLMAVMETERTSPAGAGAAGAGGRGVGAPAVGNLMAFGGKAGGVAGAADAGTTGAFGTAPIEGKPAGAGIGVGAVGATSLAGPLRPVTGACAARVGACGFSTLGR